MAVDSIYELERLWVEDASRVRRWQPSPFTGALHHDFGDVVLARYKELLGVGGKVENFGSSGHALMTVWLAGTVLQAPFVVSADIRKDAGGIYENHFTVTLKSGVTLKVTVEQLPSPEERLGDVADALLRKMRPEDADAAIGQAREMLGKGEKAPRAGGSGADVFGVHGQRGDGER